ncbi:MAG: tetratricopeptide repeat protein [Cyclobacteriaceae bacterium]|nr:tetratricopeptide repeat protein [Cyclobacteriaceae bacterium]
MIERISLILLLTFTLSAHAQAQDVARLYEQGKAAHLANRYSEALTLFNQCIRMEPTFADAYFSRASVREQLKDLRGALTDYSIFIELNPDDAEALLARGLLRYKLTQYDLAKQDFQKLLNTPPGETTTIFYRQSPYGGGTDKISTTQGGGKAYLLNYLGLCDAKLQHQDQAILHYDSAIRLEPNEADYYVNRGLSKEQRNDLAGAVQDYEKALALQPNHPLAQHNLALLTAQQGNGKAAEAKLTEIIENDSTMLFAYIERGYQRFESGYYKGALEDYNYALKIDSLNAEVWLSRGITKEKLKDFSGALYDYTKAIDLEENMTKAWLNRGNVLTKLTRYKEAIDDYTVALTYDAGYASAYYNRSIARQRLKQSAEACEDLKKAENLGMVVDKKMKDKICESN